MDGDGRIARRGILRGVLLAWRVAVALDAMTDNPPRNVAALGGIAQLALDRLGYGLVACDRRMVVLTCTGRASRILSATDPPVIGRALSSRLGRLLREAARTERPARVEPRQGGRAAYLSAVEVEGMGAIAFVGWLREEVMRESDLATALRERYELTGRDARLLFLLRSGHTNRQISSRTGWTESTVETYVHQLYDRLGVHTRGAAVALVNEILHPEA
jgi:DNA-binding NarL/FixJ family response regulator